VAPAPGSSRSDVTIIVICSIPSRIIHHTLRSIQRSVAYAQEHGLTCEVVIVVTKTNDRFEKYLDNIDAQSIDRQKIHRWQSLPTGKAINQAVSLSEGDFVSLVYGGEMVSENWIAESISVLKSSNKQTIVHPQYSVWYGQKDRLWEIQASTNKRFIPESMVEYNSFPFVLMTTAQIVRENPFPEYDTYAWSWNIITLSKNIEHLAAPGTLYTKHCINNEETPSEILPELDYLRPQGRHHSFNNREETEPLDEGRANKVLKYSRKGLERFYNSFPSRLLRRAHPRIDEFSTSMLNETRHLLRPIIKRGSRFPDWVEEELLKLHNIDLRVYPTEYLKHNIEVYNPRPGDFTKAYWELAESISVKVGLLFLVPYLKNGGAEREIANQTAAVLKLRPATRIKILSTEQSGSPGASMIDKRIEFIEAGASFHNLNLEQQARLLTTLIVQLEPRKIHLINSVAGYVALQSFSDIIAEVSKIFVTVFMIDRTPEGRSTHKFTECLTDAIDDVKRVYTDNQAVVDRLTELMGVPRSKFKVLYQPIDVMKYNTEERFKSKPAKVLWASRLDRQKRPDILAKIASKARSLKIKVEFHAYGSAELNDYDYKEFFRHAPELHYLGPYEGGLQTLQLADYDILLMTSEWEGYPNVLLEAIAGGLLPIVPEVGGIPELIKDGETGYLVGQFDDVDSYLEAIKKSISDGTHSNKIIRQAQQAIKQRHSRQAYDHLIKSLKEYLD